jgi:hypothetical protein
MFNVNNHPKVATSFMLQPFDISLYGTSEGEAYLQNRFAMFLRGLSHEARFFAFQTVIRRTLWDISYNCVQ